MRLPSLKFAAVMVTACAIAGSASSPVRAEFVSGFTGNSTLSRDNNFLGLGFPIGPLPGVIDSGVVSFAVWHNTGADWRVSLAGALGQTVASLNAMDFVVGGSPPIATTFGAPYVYMYQVVNTSATLTINTLKVRNPTLFTSGGVFLGQIFQEGGVNVTGSLDGANRGLGTVDPNTTPNTSYTVPSHTDGVLSKIVAAPVGVAWDASQTDLNTGGDGNSGVLGPNIDIQFLGSVVAGPGHWAPIAPGKTGSIVFLTSNYAPTYQRGAIRDGSLADGALPTPFAAAPEPGSLVLAGMGLFGLLGSYVRRRKLSKSSVAA